MPKTPVRVHVLQAGTYRDLHGNTVEIGAELMRALADSYDERLYAAPVVIGHPQHDSPRYGTVVEPRHTGADMDVGLTQLDPAFVDAHRAGRYPQRSLSFWPAAHPSNPTPGRPYIRHLGFLGGAPPAIKGLRPAELAADAEGVVELALDAAAPLTPDTADPEIPTMAEHTAGTVRQPETNQNPPASAPAVDLAERETAVATRERELAEREQQIAARETELRQAEQTRRREEATAFCERLADETRLRPADVPRVVEVLLTLDDARPEPAVAFAEADADGAAPQPQTAGQWLRQRLQALPPLVELGEVASKGRAAPEDARGKSDAQVAREARAYRERMQAQGITISLAEAVDAVEAGTAE